MKNDLVLFTDGNIQLEVPVSQDGESVWLSANQMAVLFDKDETNIRKHINNVFKSTEVDKDNNTQKMRVDGVKQPVAFYSLDVILAVGYRVNSQRGIAFRKWANNVLRTKGDGESGFFSVPLVFLDIILVPNISHQPLFYYILTNYRFSLEIPSIRCYSFLKSIFLIS